MSTSGKGNPSFWLIHTPTLSKIYQIAQIGFDLRFLMLNPRRIFFEAYCDKGALFIQLEESQLAGQTLAAEKHTWAQQIENIKGQAIEKICKAEEEVDNKYFGQV